MKKLILVLILFGLFILLTSEKNVVFCKKVFGFDYNSAEIETNNAFKQLSINYYGSPDYWQELALVNTWTLSSEQELLIPSLKAVQRLKQKQSIYEIDDMYIEDARLLTNSQFTDKM